MNLNTRVFLKKKFKEYYWKNRVSAPPEIEKREFGIGTLDAKIKIRHRAFKTERELNNFLKRDAPFYISYSAAYYEFPENQPMDAKNWLGADLVFDLDAEMDFFDSEKLKNVKDEVLNLLEFLISDFGIQNSDIKVNFSGTKGYHVHVINNIIRELGSDERREIIDYVTGTGLNIDYFMNEEMVDGIVVGGKRRPSILRGPKKGDPGWAGRIYDATMSFITSDEKELQRIEGIGRVRAKKIASEREGNIKFLEEGRWEALINLSKEMQKRVLRENSIKLMGDADKMVTIDTSRLIRLPNSLHGGSGLIARIIDPKNLENFDPLTEAIAFSDKKIKIKITEKIPRFEMNEQEFGPYNKGIMELPEYAGIYLLLRKRAELEIHS